MNIFNRMYAIAPLIVLCGFSEAQYSVARQWNEVLLEAIRNDLARPTVHARNLYHVSMAMYDAWAVFGEQADLAFLGKTHGSYYCPYVPIQYEGDVEALRNEAISYAAYRLIRHRFFNSPGASETLQACDTLMMELGYSLDATSADYLDGTPSSLGNYIGIQMTIFGEQDGSNEIHDYANMHYEPVNQPLVPKFSGNPDITDPNRWQPLSLDVYIDQSGNQFPFNTPDFLSPEWGIVLPFALSEDDLTVNLRGENEYWVYYDPGAPPHLLESGEGMTSEYQWGFSMVSVWSSHLDPANGVMVDISPASFGNNDISGFPTTIEGLRDHYNFFDGGDYGLGHEINPRTNEPYAPQVVPLGDYARVLAEFWADGPDSETPPGHWFTILNYVSDHPEFEKKFMGEGDLLSDLEWDIKAYFTMGGAMHDAAVTAWGVKGWYDYIRPVSALRYMADLGQSTDTNGVNYHPAGLPLLPGYIELVEDGDPLAGAGNENVGKIKVYAWRGPDFILDPDTSMAGVGWILAEDWWPYQRPNFVTPPFAGYISGHSTYSRAAAEVMTLLTGDEYFPGGMGQFHAPKNEFLVFEDGPSVDITLQWATYRDASDQTSLSRIWGGIHPPVDDIPGRLIGAVIGVDAFEYANCFFNGPAVEYDTMLYSCGNAQLEILLDRDDVDSWSWQTVDSTGQISGAENGTSDGPVVLMQQLSTTDTLPAMVTYEILGSTLNCTSYRMVLTVEIAPDLQPSADFDFEVRDTTVWFNATGENADSYLWDFGDGNTDTIMNPAHNYEQAIEYEVTLIATNQCGADTLTQLVVTTSTTDLLADEVITIAPNPTSGNFWLHSDEAIGQYQLSIFDNQGRTYVVREVELHGSIMVSAANLAPGVYYVALENSEHRSVEKLVLVPR